MQRGIKKLNTSKQLNTRGNMSQNVPRRPALSHAASFSETARWRGSVPRLRRSQPPNVTSCLSFWRSYENTEGGAVMVWTPLLWLSAILWSGPEVISRHKPVCKEKKEAPYFFSFQKASDQLGSIALLVNLESNCSKFWRTSEYYI